MMLTRLPCALVAALVTCSLFAAPASAQRARTFVASFGNDTNPCTFGAPCKTFQQAINVVAAGGEVTAIDSGGFGSITITHAVTITIPTGVEAGIVPPMGGDAITIDAGPNDAVVLRGLTVNGSGIGQNGIVFNSGGSLTISNCVVQNSVYDGTNITTGNGILIQPTSGTVDFVISDTVVIGNGSDGIQYVPQSDSPNVNGTIDNVTATGNSFFGIAINPLGATVGTTIIGISNSTVSTNGAGISAENQKVTVSIDNVTVANNGADGIFAIGTTTVLLGRSVITGNSTGIENRTALSFYSYDDNRIDKNTTADICSASGCFPLTSLTSQ
jgi:hypothetical protein